MQPLTYHVACLQQVMKLYFRVKKTKKTKHTFNYEAMKFGDFPNDVIKKQEKQMRSIWAIGTPKKR